MRGFTDNGVGGGNANPWQVSARLSCCKTIFCKSKRGTMNVACEAPCWPGAAEDPTLPCPPCPPGSNTCTGQSSAWCIKSLCSCYSPFENWPRHFAITGSWVSFLRLALRQNSFRLQKGFVPGKRTQHDAFVSAACLCQTKEARYLPFLSSKEHRNPCIPLHFTQLLSFPQSHKQRQHQGISVSMNLRSYGRLGSP